MPINCTQPYNFTLLTSSIELRGSRLNQRLKLCRECKTDWLTSLLINTQHVQVAGHDSVATGHSPKS